VLSDSKLKIDSLQPTQKYYWLDISAKAFFELKKYDKLLEVSDDMLSLGESYNIKGYKRALYYKFFALFGLRKYDTAIKVATQIESIYKDEFKNIEVYQKLVKYGKKIGNNIMVVKYAKKIIDLQNRYKSYVLSPDIELDAILALKKLGKYQEALQIAKSALKRATAPSVKARILYETGDIYLTLKDNKEAKKVFEECSKIDKDGGWSNLCKESLKLY
jgi:tetratricopeptide (TPR) repeat protein